MPDLRIKCTKPKYAIGEFQFSKFEDVYWWLTGIKGLAKGNPGRWLYGLAKSGRIDSSSAREHIEIQSDWQDYCLARDAAEKTGLLKSGPGDVYSLGNEAALAFARKLDSTLVGVNV